MKKSFFVLSFTFAGLGWAALNVPLTVQEALYAGGSTGIARTAEPFCMGVPLADSAAITSTGVLALAGATAGQFRVLGRWPDGNFKWIKVCGIIPSLPAGGTAAVTLTDGGAGNFGGANLATDNGSTITVSTGAATFTIKKANFNVIDSAVIGGSTVVASSPSPERGLIVTGPNPTAVFPANVTCGVCTTEYSSANDPNSTAAIEENGPVMTVIRATGNHLDASGNVYMQYTVRLTFYQNKSGVKVTTILRNADYNTSVTPSPDAAGNTFNTAYKGMQAYELRLSPSISGTLNYTIATSAAAQTGTMSGTDTAYIYQGQSNFMINQEAGDPTCAYKSPCANTYTTDTGYEVFDNTTQLASGDQTTVVGGWADISNSAGMGVEIGVYQMTAYFPKSLEFDAGGSDVRIGIWPRENSQPIFQAWPTWSVHDLFVNFHAAQPASLANEFLKFQHYLVARPTVSYINTTNVFPYPIVDPTVEDNYYLSVAAAATPAVPTNDLCWNGAPPCTPDRDVSAAAVGQAMNLAVTRNYGWSAGGPLNQEEFRWADLQKFLQRGFTGRFLNSAHFYRFLAEKGWPHADGTSSTDSAVNDFTWRSRPSTVSTHPPAELDNEGNPAVACGDFSKCAKLTNSANSFVAWMSLDAGLLHLHWYGMPDYYFLTGDETIRESLVPLKDYYLNMETYQAGAFAGSFTITRALGIELMGASRYADYLTAIQDPDAPNVLNQALNVYNTRIKPDVCMSGYPAGCTAPPVNTQQLPGDPAGISRVRGAHAGGRASGWCPHDTGSNEYRAQEVFMSSILIEGLLYFRRSQGPTWPDYNLALDLAYGVGQWSLNESYNDDGTTNWQGALNANGYSLGNGFRYLVWEDFSNVCPAGTAQVPGTMDQFGSSVYDHYSLSTPGQGLWFNFYIQYLMNGSTSWERLMRTQMAQVGYHKSAWPADFGSYQLGTLINAVKNPSNPVLQDVPFTVTANAGGSYVLTWTVPTGAQSYRIKWSPKLIAPSSALLNFDNLFTNSFGLNPAAYSTWFGANNVTEPAPAAAGQQQSFTINAGTSGLTAPNFSVKAYISGAIIPPTTGPASNLLLVSGSGQTGAVGQPLANPFTVMVTDANGNPVSGTTVTFTVTGGGGTMTAGSVASNLSGMASSTLTLGPNAGANTVTASSGTLTGSPITFTATGTTAVGPASAVVLVSGSGQSGTVGQPLANPFTVKVTDASGNAVSGYTVTFTVTAGGGTLTSASVATGSTGLASSTLTLGPIAGANTVTAAAGSLTGSPITFTATGTAASQVTAWSLMTATAGWPGGNGWLVLPYDPVSQQTILYGVPAKSSDIYSSDIYFYNSATNVFTHLGGTGAMVDSCTKDTPTQPGERHPDGQMAVDTRRNFLWIYGGPDESCTGGTAPNTSPRQDMYYLTLNANPLNDVWNQVSFVHFPSAAVAASMIYDPDDDVLFVYGYDGGAATNDQWIFCRTAENPTPGIPTPAQVTAGCTVGDDWNQINHGSTPPAAKQYVGLVYDTAIKKVILYGGADGGGTHHNDTWMYDIPSHTWSQMCQGGCVPPSVDADAIAIPGIVYNAATQMVLLHQTSGAGAPADWQYNPLADTWTRLASGGTPPATNMAMGLDVSQNKLVGWLQGYGAQLWQAVLPTPVLSANRCDLNNDGVVNLLDVQIAINQALGVTPCGSADLIGNGICSVIDVQRIISASMGGACVLGQ